MAAVVGHDDTLYHLSHFAEFISFAGPTEPLPPGPEPYGRVGRWDYYSVYREFID
jgi:hypothetical protein